MEKLLWLGIFFWFVIFWIFFIEGFWDKRFFLAAGIWLLVSLILTTIGIKISGWKEARKRKLSFQKQNKGK